MSLLARLRAIRTRHRIAGELEEELQFHLEQATAAHVARGMAPEEARRAALLDLGGMQQVRHRVGDIRRIGVETLVRDARLALRGLLRAPLFTLASVATIALMTGGITSVYAVFHGLVLQPLPYPRADRLLFLETMQPKRFGRALDLRDVEYLRESTSFEAWGLSRIGYSGTVMTGTQALSQALGWGYFEKLGKQKIMQVQSSTEPPKKLAQGERPVHQARVGILGLTFKENVPDIRNSRVPDILAELATFGITPLAHDPLADPREIAAKATEKSSNDSRARSQRVRRNRRGSCA